MDHGLDIETRVRADLLRLAKQLDLPLVASGGAGTPEHFLAAFAVADADAVLSDDSGLMVDALGGAPGVYSARYAGEGHDDAANNAKLLDALKDVPGEKRTARFRTSVALIRRGMPAVTANGSVEGVILHSPQGENGFGYDPLFYYEPLKKSFAQLTPEEKNSVSHRRRALESLCDKLRAEK